MLFKLLFRDKPDSLKTIFFLVLIYILVLMWGFIDYLVPIWGYFGIEYEYLSIEIKLIPVFFGLLPVFWMPLKITRPTMFAYWILYLLTYIPMIVGSSLEKRFETSDRILIALSYFIGFIFLGLSYKFKLYRVKEKKIKSIYFWNVFYAITFIMFMYVLYVFKDNLTFVDVFASEKVYDLRFSGQEIEEKSAFGGYFIMWLSNALFPFLISVGLVNKDKKKIVIGILGMFILYMTMANKQFLFAIIFTIFIYWLFKIKSQKKITILLLVLIIPSTILIYSQTIAQSTNFLMFSLSGIFLLRTIYTSSFMSIYYNIFFENHPHIYFSHISGINKIVDYPYKKQLGIEVGSYFTEFSDFNANANFFITDGLSSIGLIGIPLVGILCTIVFFIFDSISSRINLILPILLISNASIALMNVSLFTTLISGGLLFYMLLMVFGRNVIENTSQKI